MRLLRKRHRGFIGLLACLGSSSTTSGFLESRRVSFHHPPALARRSFAPTTPSQPSRLARHIVASERRFLRKDDEDQEETNDADVADPASSMLLVSRRSVLQQAAVMMTASSSTAVVLAGCCGWPQMARAGKPELDSSGQLYSPKSEMLSGGSQAARGIPVEKGRVDRLLKPGQVLQTVYETRFIAYLSRFLLNFDPAAHAWWIKQGVGDTWEELTTLKDKTQVDNTFAEFAESVEVGLSDYFVGPYGSYSNLSAMKAGLSAAQPARSKRPDDTSKRGFLGMNKKKTKVSDSKSPSSATDVAKQGILNLYTLLKARYTSIAAKRQLAILFSFISSPELQPRREIAGLLGEADNATISRIQVFKEYVSDEFDSRTSSLRGGGYSLDTFPKVIVDAPPALGDAYPASMARPVMRSTSRVLKVVVTDPGEGYMEAPQVRVLQNGIRRACQAAAVLDRNGHVESILVLDPGYGYGGRKDAPPQVQIEPPPRPKRNKGGPTTASTVRPARAVAELEYEIVDIEIERGGNGYVKSEPPLVQVSPPPQDPDWFIDVQEQPELRMAPVADKEGLRAAVTEMKFADGNVAYSITGMPTPKMQIDDTLLDRLQRDPLELLPSSVRPQLRQTGTQRPIYTVPVLDSVPQVVAVLSPRYRAYDPVFGGVGKVPITKGALELRAGEYARLALSGAVCTVVVRTLLNPLELVKTKQQLKNDQELLDYVIRKREMTTNINKEEPMLLSSCQPVGDLHPLSVHSTEGASAVVATPQQATIVESIPRQGSAKEAPVGTVDMLRGIVELRGPLALFQSADITFLASLAFGSFGFGATELFRRYFTAVFFSGDGNTMETGSEIILLIAAALATVVTAAVAAPFELLRVRSMGLLEPTKWTNVLQDFVESKSDADKQKDFELRSLKPQDVLPLWSGFSPTLSRELPFAIAKFLTFDLLTRSLVAFFNSQAGEGALPIQVGVGPLGLAISAASGALAGIAGAIVSHPADLILTKTSARSRSSESTESSDWREVVKDLIGQEGGYANLFVGLGARSIFFFLVIGLQFFLYDYVKNLFQVGSDDLNLVLDVFYAVRAGLGS